MTTPSKANILVTMISNYLIWFVPSLILMALTVVLLVFLLGAGFDAPADGEKKDPFRNWPKGIIGALGINYFLGGLAVLFSFLYFDNIDAEGWIYIIALSLICFLLGFWAVRYDVRRLKVVVGKR